MTRFPMSLHLPAAMALCLAAAVSPLAARAAEPDFSGPWVITAGLVEGPVSTGMELKREGDGYTGKSGALDTLAFRPLEYVGRVVGGRLQLTARSMGLDLGTLDLGLQGQTMGGKGRLFGTDVAISAHRPVDISGHVPRTIDHDPTQFHPIMSAMPPPALRIFPGDTVRTRTVDTYGRDEKDVQASMPGNPGTGPFYVEGAMPGDTVAIHFISLKTNRATARMNTQLDGRVLFPGYSQSAGAVRDNVWLIDPAKGAAALRTPSEKLKNFKVPLKPMMGVVGVAFPGGLSTPNRDLGEWGGNLDYTEIKAGVTLYLPVYQAGAMIFMGDGHAVQGHGEVAGQGLETTLAAEFKVTLIKGQPLQQPWAENADHIMVSGIDGSLNDAMQRATTGLARWLKRTYELDDSEVAAVLGTSLEYDIAEVVDPKFHVVAKLRKDVLSQIPLPAK